MSRGASTARRYAADNGPVVFGIPGIDVRWNRESRCIVIEADDASGARWCETGEVAELLIVALADAHRRGQLRERLRAVLAPERASLFEPAPDFYRCGRLMCWRPAWQSAARPLL